MPLLNTSKAATASPFRNFNSIYFITFRRYIVDASGRVFLLLALTHVRRCIWKYRKYTLFYLKMFLSTPPSWASTFDGKIYTHESKEKIVHAWEQFYTNLREISLISLLGMHRWRLVQWFYHDFAFRTTIVQIKFYHNFIWNVKKFIVRNRISFMSAIIYSTQYHRSIFDYILLRCCQ